MNKFVFDSSAILALYYNEPGKKKVRSLLDQGQPMISAANLCEVFTKLLRDDLHADAVWETFQPLEIEVAGFDAELAIHAAQLRASTKHLGLSLGDRACLALASRENAIAVTADRWWAKLNICKVEVIR